VRDLPLADPGVPELRSPIRFLGWIACGQPGALAGGVIFGVMWRVGYILVPATLGWTVRSNLLLAHSDADDETIWTALTAVDALPWVNSLPAGLDTQVGSGGYPLSPAQTQQLALARLILADPHTLILDEATSLLDPSAARHLERSLAAVLAGRTVVAIAHRLHTAYDADWVAVVEDGRITEHGSHQALVTAGGSYAALWRSWHDQPADS